MIPYGRQDISVEDIEQVVSVLRSDFLTQGPKVPEFEKAIADYCNVKYVSAVNSATSALHIACLSLGVGPGDRVWTSPISFVASSNCALYCGASVDFVDIDPLTFNLCARKLEEKLLKALQENALPKVVIVVHFAGQSGDMKAIHSLSEKFKFRIIEDASHAIGGSYLNKKIGSCEFSDITVFSFHPVKIITTCEGGAVTTNQKDLSDKMQLLRSHGITRDETQMANASHGPWYYEQVELGYNYRMTDVQAALGISQMKRIEDFLSQRHQIFQDYKSALSNQKHFLLPTLSSESHSALHLYVVRLVAGSTKKTHREVFEELRGKGIGVNLHYLPIYLQPYYQKLGFQKGYCPEAEAYYETAISIPMYPKLHKKDFEKVVDALLSI